MRLQYLIIACVLMSWAAAIPIIQLICIHPHPQYLHSISNSDQLICIPSHTLNHCSISNSAPYYDMIAIERYGRFVEQPTNICILTHTRYHGSISNSPDHSTSNSSERWTRC
ncbi:hypothetical protein F5H01DRAFT_323054 [Linnemannia elongata]|nr:hypothetical protein F5H01DRAFT_323054 [Linnemannia elongata]